MQKIKGFVKHIIKPDCFLYKAIRKIYHFVSKQKYKICNYKKIKKQNIEFEQCVDKAVKIISEFSEKKYIIFYNPTWLGVAASTKGLFKYNVPLEQVFGRKNIDKISNAIINSDIETVIFSQIVDGWTTIIEKIKKQKPEIDVKVIWHGNCYEFFSDYTWNLNKEVMELYNKGYINCFGFVRTTMYEFYKKVGFKSCYLQNNVHKNVMEKVTNSNDKIKIGIYNADSRELKNIYTSLSAIRMVPNAIADVVPINEGALEFTNIIGLDVNYEKKYISNDELMKRIQKNDINIYPTYTENAPMFPLESLEMGVVCLLGNNNDYFVGTELGKYLIIEREDDPLYIKNKIVEALENKNKIMSLYRDWKKDFDSKCEEYVKLFINA